MKDWILFLDDIRFPEDVRKHIGAHSNIIICRTIDDAMWCVKKYGLPQAIHFDHDMTEKHYGKDYTDRKTGLDFAKWFSNHVQKQGVKLPDSFTYGVHSMNAERSRMIHDFMLDLGAKEWG